MTEGDVAVEFIIVVLGVYVAAWVGDRQHVLDVRFGQASLPGPSCRPRVGGTIDSTQTPAASHDTPPFRG